MNFENVNLVPCYVEQMTIERVDEIKSRCMLPEEFNLFSALKDARERYRISWDYYTEPTLKEHRAIITDIINGLRKVKDGMELLNKNPEIKAYETWALKYRVKYLLA